MMPAKPHGFTLMEMMVTVLILGTIARLAVMALPPRSPGDPFAAVVHSARWASRLAQTEGVPYRLHIFAQRWYLTRLVAGNQGEPGSLPNTVWQKVSFRGAEGRLTHGAFFDASPTALQRTPALITFSPEGETDDVTLAFQPPHGDPLSLPITAALITHQGTP
ncbi:prepilin-type N-terminal cleavage/methylation domain-containing protein [Pantoea sp. Mb-10]|uniref:prepilin-type N-terminal cleavage/methylation domain-containing protein n=1 Tax=unclassified Pantoea TaxID=2630326 RepID=UPI001E2E17C8|nr:MULTISPECIES: prepilin-type N-terminal cleavage/methylation domain-containing protein [unclassified Pantoea]MCE0489651.1 prepilin-type N-terminal cleavage/methylation domain-containing protein [Pantoea sp. Mb-10]MCE0501244.1 prepilin-type N-terminal cleavage/methylation domain-containing protein [Pantoea sp. Pb-8]